MAAFNIFFLSLVFMTMKWKVLHFALLMSPNQGTQKGGFLCCLKLPILQYNRVTTLKQSQKAYMWIGGIRGACWYFRASEKCNGRR